MTAVPPGGVVLTAEQVDTLRAYLARAHDYGNTIAARDDARIQLCGYLAQVLDAAQETPQ